MMLLSKPIKRPGHEDHNYDGVMPHEPVSNVVIHPVREDHNYSGVLSSMPKIQIVSNVVVCSVLSPAHQEDHNYSQFSNEAVSCSSPKIPRISSISQRQSSSDAISATPRKKKLLRKIGKLQQVSFSRKNKIDGMRKKILRKNKKIASLKNIIKDLRRQRSVADDDLEILSKMGGASADLFLRQVSKGRKKALPKSYSKEMKKFALTLNYYSPAAYNYLRRHFSTCLPHPHTISRWYQSIDPEPGFTSESFKALKLRAEKTGHKLRCSLIIDEMSIRQLAEWDGKKYSGFVDMGTNIESDNLPLAKNALALLLVCINGHWKLPVGYFLIAGMGAGQKKTIILQCLEKAAEVGSSVESITFDGPSVNISVMRKLGCRLDSKNLITTFKHPTNTDVEIFLDPCHMRKLIRNTIGEKGSMVDGNGELILWRYIENLHKFQEKENFHLANKIRSQHVQFKKQKMKVKLASQAFSESVATALEFCRDTLRLPEFAEAGATIRFLRVFDKLFNVLNSRNLLQHDYKKPI